MYSHILDQYSIPNKFISKCKRQSSKIYRKLNRPRYNQVTCQIQNYRGNNAILSLMLHIIIYCGVLFDIVLQ